MALTPEEISANAVSISVYKITSNLTNDEIQQVVIRLQEFLEHESEQKKFEPTSEIESEIQEPIYDEYDDEKAREAYEDEMRDRENEHNAEIERDLDDNMI